MILIHLIARPYVDNIHNIFDGIVLQIIVIISVLPLIEFTDNYNETLVTVVAYIFVILPLPIFITKKLWINRNKIKNIIKSLTIKYFHKYSALPTDDMEILPTNDIGISADGSVRRNATVVNK